MATMPFVDLAAQRERLGRRLDEALLRVLDHGRYIMGPEVAELEAALAERAGVRHVVSCSSGTDALVLGLLARDVGPGDAVLVPSFTFAATAESVAITGATPVFVDCRADDFDLDPDGLAGSLAAAEAAGLRPVGVVPVDLFGQPARYPEIATAADAAGLWVLADAAQSFGGDLDGTPVGGLAPCSATSFFPAKPLGCAGDGGAVFTDDDELHERLVSLRVHGQGRHKYENVRIGINGRLDTLQAAVLLEKLRIFDDEIDARQQVAQRYTEALAGVVATPEVRPGARSAWAQYTVLVEDRDRVAAELADAGVPTAVYYPLGSHQQAAYRSFPVPADGLPVTEALAGQVLSLPMHPYLEASDQQRVVDALAQAVGT